MKDRPWQRHYDFDLLTTIRYPKIPAHQLALFSANAFPDKAALSFLGKEMTFWELRRRIFSMANALAARGLKKGDRVGLQLPVCPQYVIACYAVLSLGAIIVNLNPMYTTEELKALTTDTGVSDLITFDSVLPNIKSLCREVEIRQVIVTRMTDFLDDFRQSAPSEMELEEGWKPFSSLLGESFDAKVPRVEVLPEDSALIQFTGGTTGIPKGAVLTHGNLVAATLQLSLWGAGIIKRTPVDKRTFLCVLPFFHVFGLVGAMSHAMLSCATQILVPRFEIDEFMDLLAGLEEITFFPSVPTMITAILNHPMATKLDLGKKIKLLNSGGAPMPTELIDRVKEMGIPYVEGWGMSETATTGMANPPLGLKKAGSIGVPLPDTDVRLVDIEEGEHDVRKGEPGEIIIKSPAVMKEYWNNPEESRKQLKDGWLYTGDIAVQDEDDYFSIVDRKKDMIIAGGYNIYPREIDEVLYRHPKIQEASTIGVPDEYRGETVKAFIVPKKGEVLTEAEVVAFCKERLAAFKRPRFIEFREELPKSAVGKILRKKLRAEEQQNISGGKNTL